MKRDHFNLKGFKIEIVRYKHSSFLYPAFNGNAEFKFDKQGFKELSTYIRNIIWMNKVMGDINFTTHILK